MYRLRFALTNDEFLSMGSAYDNSLSEEKFINGEQGHHKKQVGVDPPEGKGISGFSSTSSEEVCPVPDQHCGEDAKKGFHNAAACRSTFRQQNTTYRRCANPDKIYSGQLVFAE